MKTSHQQIERRERSIRTVAVLLIVFLLGTLAIPQGDSAFEAERSGNRMPTAAVHSQSSRSGSPGLMAAY